MQTALQAWTGGYLCGEPSGRVVADRAAIGPWETWTVVPTAGGVALRADHGGYLCAEPDGRLVADRTAIGPWERWTAEPDGDHVALQSAHGAYLCVEPDGRVVADRLSIGPWERFLATAPWWRRRHPDPLRGVLRASYARGTEDDTGPRLAVLCHAGDILSRYVRDAATVRAHLDTIAAAGYHGVRTWTVLSGPYWDARTGPVHPGSPADYWTQLAAFATELRVRGLRWLVSQGDLMRWVPAPAARAAYMAALAQTLREVGGLDVVCGVDAGNETWQNGEDDPARLAAALGAFLAVLPVPIATLTSPWAEEEANRFLTAGTLRDIHSWRGAWPSPARRVFNIGYEAEPHVFTVQSEGPGPGRHVSAMAEPAVFLEPETMGVLAAVHAIGKALYVYMSSPGVISDEPFDAYPAFGLVPKLYARLPRAVQTWSVFHGGGGRSWSAQRVLAVPEDDGLDVRCDHAASGPARMVVVYGPPGTYRLRVVSSFEGVLIDPGTLDETPVQWRAGETVALSFRRGRVLVGSVR